jgi:hypothetical protein
MNTIATATATTTRTFLPNNESIGAGSTTRLTLDERNVITYGQERNAIEFFDSHRNRDIRAVMGSNRAPFLS